MFEHMSEFWSETCLHFKILLGKLGCCIGEGEVRRPRATYSWLLRSNPPTPKKPVFAHDQTGFGHFTTWAKR